ncbi:MAG: TonB-dependent receptor [Sphingomonas sp.]
MHNSTFIALSCVGAFISAPAHASNPAATAAATPDDADQRADIIVIGERERETPKQVAPLLDAPRSIAVLPQQLIEQTGSASLTDALRTVPGITFGAAEGGNPIGDRPFIRGFDTQGSTYVDGVRDFAAQSREVFAVDSVQIVRGSDSTLGGRGSAGGSINILSKAPNLLNSASASISLGSADYKRLTADVNQRLSGSAAFRIEGVWHDQDVAGRDALYQRRWGIAPSIAIGLDTPTRLSVSYYYLESHELPDSGIPYLFTTANAPLGETITQPALGRITTISGATGNVDRRSFYGLVDRDFRDTTTHQATLRAEHDFGHITLRNTARFTANTQNYIYTQPDDSQGNVFGTNAANPATAGGLLWRRANSRASESHSLIDQIDLFGSFKTGGIKHSFSAGAEFAFERAQRGTLVTRGFVNAAGNEILSAGATLSPRCTPEALARFYCTSLFAPNPTDAFVNYTSDTSTTPAPIVRSQPIGDTINDGRTQSLYAFDSITLAPQLILNLGARFDHFTSQVQPGQPIAATERFSLERTDNLFNWQAGLVYKPVPNISLYTSYATAATPPNSLLGEGREGNALGTTDTQATRDTLALLRPERTRSFEIGAKANLLGGKASVSVAGFQTRTDNARVTGEDGLPQFVGSQRITGVEIGVNGELAKGWTVFGGYTHLDGRITDGGFTVLTAAATGGQAAQTVLVPSVNTGQRTPQVPSDSASLWSNVELGRFSIGGGAFYTGQVFGGYADNRRAVQDAAGVVTIVPATRTISRAVPGYVRFDLRAGYRVNRHVELSVNAQNLTDKAYFTQVNPSHFATLAPGRSVFATLTLKQ